MRIMRIVIFTQRSWREQLRYRQTTFFSKRERKYTSLYFDIVLWTVEKSDKDGNYRFLGNCMMEIDKNHFVLLFLFSFSWENQKSRNRNLKKNLENFLSAFKKKVLKMSWNRPDLHFQKVKEKNKQIPLQISFI